MYIHILSLILIVHANIGLSFSRPQLILYSVYTFEDTILSLEDVKEESKVNSVAEQPKKPSNNVTEPTRKPRRQRKNTVITFKVVIYGV